MAVVEYIKPKVAKNVATDIYLFFFNFYYRGVRIIDNGVSKRRTRNARFRARRADHSTTCMCMPQVFKYKDCMNKDTIPSVVGFCGFAELCNKTV